MVVTSMSVSEDYITYVLDQLEYVGPARARRMFGGAGLYLDGLFFAILANDTLYFKVDDVNRPDYEALGMCPFRPDFEKSYSMQYCEVPPDVLEDRGELRLWANKALDAATRKSSGKKRRLVRGEEKNDGPLES